MKHNMRIKAVAAALMLSATALAGATSYSTVLTGAQESTPNNSTAFGAAVVDFDLATHLLEVDLAFSGLAGDSSASHIHCCTGTPGLGAAGVATQIPTFTGFPLGVSSGAYSHVFDTSQAGTWNPAFLSLYGGTAGAESALLAGLNAGEAYLNIHSSAYPGGEISGFLKSSAVTTVPEPESLALLAFGLPLMLGYARRRRR